MISINFPLNLNHDIHIIQHASTFILLKSVSHRCIFPFSLFSIQCIQTYGWLNLLRMSGWIFTLIKETHADVISETKLQSKSSQTNSPLIFRRLLIFLPFQHTGLFSFLDIVLYLSFMKAFTTLWNKSRYKKVLSYVCVYLYALLYVFPVLLARKLW